MDIYEEVRVFPSQLVDIFYRTFALFEMVNVSCLSWVAIIVYDEILLLL